MANINSVTVSGNLTRDPEYKQVSEGFGVAKLGIAVNRQRKDKDGDGYIDEVSFFDIEVLGEGYAKLVSRKLKKGDSATVQGRLEQQRWEKDGEARSKVVIIASQIDSEGFFRSKDEDNDLDATPEQPELPAATPAAEAPAPADDDIPF